MMNHPTIHRLRRETPAARNTRGARRPVALRGFTLIEVLVAMLLLSIGFLAMAAMHASALRYSHLAGYRAVAAQIASGLAERIHAANPDEFNTYTDYSGKCPTDADETEEDTNDRATEDLEHAQSQACQQLPQGKIYTQAADDTSPSALDIWVQWTEPQAADSVPSNCPTLDSKNNAPEAGTINQCLGIRTVRTVIPPE